VAQTAREQAIELAQPESVNSDASRARIAMAAPEAVCVCAYGALIREPLLSEHRLLNVHPSLLPRWRGAAPIERAIMAGDERTGVSIIRLTAGLDSGPVCSQAPEQIRPADTFGTLSERLCELGGELLIDTLNRLPDCTEQGETGVTYADKLSAEDRLLDPTQTAVELERRVRALNPHIGAVVAPDDGPRLAVWQARALRCAEPAPGELSLKGSIPVLGCSHGALELVVVQPPGRRAMSGADYLRGRVRR
jgi:methionyl-tRNA formyltransferase